MISMLCVLLFPGVEMIYIYICEAFRAIQIHFNEVDKADIKSHSYKCSMFMHLNRFLCQTFETVSKMTRIRLF